MEDWNQFGPPIHYVSYENLHTRYDEVLEEIAGILGQPAVSGTRPTLDAPSSLPWKGTIGAWKEFFTKADIKYFDQHTKQLQP